MYPHGFEFLATLDEVEEIQDILGAKAVVSFA